MKKSDVEFSVPYSIKSKYDDTMHAVVTWFDCEFSRLKNPVMLSTSPYNPYTHWKQTIFYLDKPFTCRAGDEIKGSIAVRQNKTNFREQDIKFSYHLDGQYEKQDHTQMYKLR